MQPSAFGDTKANAEAGSDDKGSSLEGLGDTNIFARSSKGTKRKEDAVVPSSGPEKPPAEEDAPAETDLPRHPPKRPLMRSRGPPPGLFGRALSGLRRDVPVRRDAAKESQQQASELEEAEGEGVQTQDENLTAATPEAQTLTREVMEKAGESGEMLKLYRLTVYYLLFTIKLVLVQSYFDSESNCCSINI